MPTEAQQRRWAREERRRDLMRSIRLWWLRLQLARGHEPRELDISPNSPDGLHQLYQVEAEQ